PLRTQTYHRPEDCQGKIERCGDSVRGYNEVLHPRRSPLMSLKQLIGSGTKVWSDSIDPQVIKVAPGKGITGATSHPISIADILKKSGFDEKMSELIEKGMSDSDIAWWLDDYLVKEAQKQFMPVWEKTKGNDGYVSFELDPLLEDATKPTPKDEAVRKY